MYICIYVYIYIYVYVYICMHVYSACTHHVCHSVHDFFSFLSLYLLSQLTILVLDFSCQRCSLRLTDILKSQCPGIATISNPQRDLFREYSFSNTSLYLHPPVRKPCRWNVAVRCSALQRVAARCSALRCVAVRCGVLQCVAVCCSAYLRILVFDCIIPRIHRVSGSCSVLQRAAVCCSVLRFVPANICPCLHHLADMPQSNHGWGLPVFHRAI